ncbi:GntR family transcriptional regulator [Amycolatopsis sp. GM8]|uniref:GntR family transcriptional regulator n=1 Tax=Amycolatopsis sp. GM8 TaxID=2896530 RepID=UPI001F3C941F|nr:GntR family transcriptional regulator [Amycolatopsis sp. GM8]
MAVESGVERCLTRIRSMVLSGELLPGQKVLQKDLADTLGVSRIPLREALAQLHAEGILDHRPNTGFTVGRFNSEDLVEIYLMRRLLETELIRSAELALVDVDRMKELNKHLSTIDPLADPLGFQRVNKDFHFTAFEASPLARVRDEVNRLWYMSGFYRAFIFYVDDRAESLYGEHAGLIAAIEDRDHERFVRLSDEHRHLTEMTVVRRLGRTRLPDSAQVV